MLKNSLSFLHLLFASVAFLLSSTSPFCSRAQITPVEKSKLNYRIIGFSCPVSKEHLQYQLEIAMGYFTENDVFGAHVEQTITSDKNKIVAEVPSFGSVYTWRMVSKRDGSRGEAGKLHHFYTGTLPENISKIKKLTVDYNKMKYTNAYVVYDGGNAIYDMDGRPVWYFPGSDSLTLESDVKVTSAGTISFLSKGNAYEINYNAGILWTTKKRPNGDITTVDVLCHHELVKLNNGHYLTLAGEARSVGSTPPDRNKNHFFPPAQSTTLAEIDQSGAIVWSWESSKYVQQSDLLLLQQKYPNMPLDLHENSFYFNEKENEIYISMSGVNRIVKIKYPSGNVLREYGSKLLPSDIISSDTSPLAYVKGMYLLNNDLFSHQHSLKQSDDGFLYLFNNNVYNAYGDNLTTTNGPRGNSPHVIKMEESGDTLKKVWDFDCTAIIADQKIVQSSGGGNIVVLPDHSLFVSMCMPYNNMFIIDTNKNILWSAFTETYDPESKSWEKSALYRANIITRTQMEQMIWSVPQSSL